MRTLTLLRHAKSSWKNPALADIERPLNKRGRRAADAMAAHLVAHGVTFATVLASPARRSRETIMRILLALPARNTTLKFDHAFYVFEAQGLIDALGQLDDDLLDVLVVGHNPALEDAISFLTGKRLQAFPTAACAQLAIELPNWATLHEACAELVWLLRPDGETSKR